MDMTEISRMSASAQRQILDRLGRAATEKANKYHAEKAHVGKMWFDSRKESARYQELMLLLKAGKIRKLKV